MNPASAFGVVPYMVRACAKLFSFFGARPWVALVAAAVFGGATYFLVVEFRVRGALHAAQEGLDRDDLDDARRNIDYCLKLRLDAPTVLLLAARIARLHDAPNDAEQYLVKLEELHTTTAESLLERRLLSAQQGDLEPVLEALRSQLAQSAPDDRVALLILEALAKGFMERGVWPEAIAYANGLCPTPSQPRVESARHLCLRGMIWEKIAQQAEPHVAEQHALADFARAVELDPKQIDARLHLAGILYQAGRAAEAAAHFECVRGCRPDSAAALLGLAKCRIALAQLDAADQLLETLVTRYPDDWEGLLERGRQAFHHGQFVQAEAWLRRAVAAAPPYAAEPFRLLRYVLLAQKMDTPARHVQEQEERVEAANLRVEMLIMKASKPGVEAALCFEIGKSQTELGRPHAGSTWCLSALQIDPHYAPAHRALADCFDRLGQKSRAARHLQAAHEATP